MTPTEFVNFLKEDPLNVEFENVITLIDAYYKYTPTAFTNGLGAKPIVNKAGENEGSCKIFAFARMQGLTEAQTLACFGRHYREEVLPHPDDHNHQNIRRFIVDGWKGIKFDRHPLILR
jgi:hypothetical protein